MAEPIRVAHVVGKMVGGGVEQVVMNYYRHIDRDRVQFDFLVDADSTLVPREEIESLGGRVFVIPPYQRVIAYQRVLTHLFQDQGWDIVHSHLNSLSVLPLMAANRAGVPIRIAHSHSTAGKGEPTKNALKWALRLFSNVYPTHRIACSKHAGEWLFGTKKSFDIMYNAIDINRFHYNPSVRSQMRSSLGIIDGQMVIGHIGRFMRQKNHKKIINIFNCILKKKPDSILILVGEGSLKTEIQRLVVDLGIEKSVWFLGQRDDVASLYQVFDIFLLPSTYEGLGMVAVEAQISGLHCICSDQVPAEVDISGNCIFLPISQTCNHWAEMLILNSAYPRKNIKNNIQINNYCIEEAAKTLVRYYSNLENEITGDR